MREQRKRKEKEKGRRSASARVHVRFSQVDALERIYGRPRSGLTVFYDMKSCRFHQISDCGLVGGGKEGRKREGELVLEKVESEKRGLTN